MIYSRFGGEIRRITHYDPDTDTVTVVRANGDKRDWAVADLKADGGFSEIREAIEDLSRNRR